MASPDSFFWYDYETFGSNPRKDRPAQIAGQRTTPDLEMVGEPINELCVPAPDFLPDPEACLVHGVTPQTAQGKGLRASQFAGQIAQELERPGTCTVGFNANKFDHEVTRFLFYRTLRPPYEWHYKNGRSKWDLINVARAAYALRPDGIAWPTRSDGAPSFKLVNLATANGLAHEDAHDALSDVNATIQLARLLKESQSGLFNYALSLRDKQTVRDHFDTSACKPVVHTSQMYPAETGATTLVAPLAKHPIQDNKYIVYDLRHDPTHAVSLSSDKLRDLLFTSKEDLPDGVKRPALKTINVSKCPFVAPAKAINDRAARRISLDRDACRRHRDILLEHEGFADRAAAVYDRNFPETQDVDHALYSDFIGDHDRRKLDELRRLAPRELASATPDFNDERFPRLFRRYVARNHLEALSETQRTNWYAHCRRMLSTPSAENEPSPFETFFGDVTDHLDEASSNKDQDVLQELYDYGRNLQARLEEGAGTSAN